MTEIDTTIPPGVRMQQLLSGFAVSQALYVVAELGIATALVAGPRSVADLAREVRADPTALKRLIRFVTPIGVFRTDGELVEVTDFGKTLADGPADSMRGMARYWMQTHYAPFTELLSTVRTGTPAATSYLGKPFFAWVAENERLAEIQNAAMAGGSRVARGDLLQTYRLPEDGTVADIGGADGGVLAELLANDPKRKGIVFDLPAVVEQARENLESAGLADRTTVVAGSFFEQVPPADVYVLSSVLHDWPDETSAEILRTIGASAKEGARLVLFEIVVPEGDSPHFTKFVDLVMMAMLGGRERTEAEWRDLLASAGFRFDRIVAGSGIHSAIEATFIN